uniref:Brevinin-2Ra n=1 Tax=Pelophylax ridibundus TaxID=8406 RepID=BR2A_PELRI|nr:RecName: Full=Brevinin-2Ra [Pelophylax ridibundus]
GILDSLKNFAKDAAGILLKKASCKLSGQC